MERSLSDSVWNLEEGYCLWVGAGVTKQLAAGYSSVPLWHELTCELEKALPPLIKCDESADFPYRLGKCAAALGDEVFRAFLRERYYTELCSGLLTLALETVDAEPFIPDSARALAALGHLANPIVSFNIEPLSSLLLARPAGPVRIIQQAQGRPAFTWREPAGCFQRLVYHPHGLATSETVMTTSQYQTMNNTLAFELAIHSAFKNNLAIVGMSLDDDYLRSQIGQFRSSIGTIYWFNDHFSEDRRTWAEQCDITIVQTKWHDFWRHWLEVPIDIRKVDLALAWHMAVNEATDEAEGGPLGSLQRSLSELDQSNISQGFRELAARLAQAGSLAGEPGKKRMIRGKEPRAIELLLRKRIQDAGFRTAIVSYNQC